MAKTIAWIEDDIPIINPVVRPLERAGYKFVPFQTATEVLNAVEQLHKADLILLDIIFPPAKEELNSNHYTGVELLRMLRENYGVKTPVMALTVVTRPEVYEQLKNLGVVDIIHKPIRPSELKERVERVWKTET